MAKDSEREMVATIVASYATRSDVGVDDIVALYQRLMGGSEPSVPNVVPMAEAPTPAVPIDRAMTEDKVYCLCCGRGFKMLKRHLGAEHNLTEAMYRTMFNLPEDLPLVAPSYSRQKAEHAKKAGFGKYTRPLTSQEDAEI